MSSTNNVVARLNLTERLELRLPKRTRIQTLLLTHALLAARNRLPADVAPPVARDLLQQRNAQLRAHLDATEAFDAQSAAPPQDPIAIPDTLQHLAATEDLATPVGLDHAIEARARIVDLTSATLSTLPRPDDDPDLQAARHLQRRFFPEGRTFLQRPLREQYQLTRSAFQTLAPEDAQALDQLRLRREVTEIHLLNEQLGALLGVHNPPKAAAALVDPFDDLLGSLGRWVAAVLSAFPDPSPEHAAARTTLLAPILPPQRP